MTICRLEGPDPAEQPTGALQRGDPIEQPVAHLDRPARVDLRGTGLLAETNDSHLGQPALDRALEAGVWLDAIDWHDPVGAGRVAIEVQGHAVVRAGDLDGLHRRSDLAIDCLLGHPQGLQHRSLALGRGAAVAAHCRHDERCRTEGAQAADRAPQHRDSFDQAATAGAHGDGHAIGDGSGQPLDDLLVGGCLDIGDRLGMRDRQDDLGERRYGEVGMEGKVNSLEQLFPGVHRPDANPDDGSPPDRGCHTGPVEPVDGVYRTPRGLRVAADAVSWVATRSGGPGGQHANTSDTAVTVTIEVDEAGLSATIRDRVLGAVGPTITASSAGSRSQFRNRATAWAAALERLDEAAKPPPPPRRATRPSASAVRKRLASKRHVAQRKQARRPPSGDE